MNSSHASCFAAASRRRQRQRQQGTMIILALCCLLIGLCDGVRIRNQGRAKVLGDLHRRPSNSERDLQTSQVCNAATTLSGSILIDVKGNLLSDSSATLVGQAIVQQYNSMISQSCAIGERRVSLVQTINAPTYYDQKYTLEFRLQAASCVGCKSSPTLLAVDSQPDTCPCQGPTLSSFYVAVEDLLHNLYDLDVRNVVELQEIAAVCQPFVEFSSSDVLMEFEVCSSSASNYSDPSVLDNLAQQFLNIYNYRNAFSSGFCDPFFREITSASATRVVDPTIRRSRQRKMKGGNDDSNKDGDDDGDDDDGGTYGTSNSGSGGGNQFEEWTDDVDDTSELTYPPAGSATAAVTTSYTVAAATTSYPDAGSATTSYPATSASSTSYSTTGAPKTTSYPVTSSSTSDQPPYFEGEYLTAERSSGSGCDTTRIQVRIDIVARCRGCDINTITLFDQEEDVNHFEGFEVEVEGGGGDDDDDGGTSGRRILETETKTPIERDLVGETCRCPISPSYRAVTEHELQETLSAAMPTIEVKDVIEIELVQCAPMTNEFSSSLSLSCGTDANVVPSAEVLDIISSKFVQSYRDLSQRFCDPYFRDPSSVQVVRRRQLRGPPRTPFRPIFNFTFRFTFSFSFLIKGICRGCPAKSPLFNVDAVRRRSLFEGAHQFSSSLMDGAVTNSSLMDGYHDEEYYSKARRIQQGDQCFCAAVDPLLGAPTEREFVERFDQDLASLNAVLGSNYTVTGLMDDSENPLPTEPRREITCMVAADCVAAKEGTFCVSNKCLHTGNLRYTLTWTGDDDLDLAVYTPVGTAIWYNNPFDAATNGAFDTDFVQTSFGNHVESIYFPAGPAGVYRFEVASYESRGTSADQWTLQIFDRGQVIKTVTGTGSRLSSLTDMELVLNYAG